MFRHLRAFVSDDDHRFLKTLIGLAMLNALIIFWLGLHMAGNPAYIPLNLTVGPLVSDAIQTVAGKPHTPPPVRGRAKTRTLPRTAPLPVAMPVSKPQATIPDPPGGGILKRIVFASNRDSRFYQIYMIDSNGGHLERLTHSHAFDRDPHVAYNGRWLVFSSNRQGSYQIFKMNLKDRSVTQLTYGEEDKTNPIWSPDNSKILYTVHRGYSSYLMMMNGEGGQQQVITQPGGHHYGYGFSRDCSKVSYEAINRDHHEIFIYDLEKKCSYPIVDYKGLADVGDPVFSPKEDQLVFTSDTLNLHSRQIYLYNEASRTYNRITKDKQDKDDPVFSPDGKMIAYIAKWNNAWNIFVMNADGSHVRNITQSRYDHVVPSWR